MATDAQRLEWVETKFFNPKEDIDTGYIVWYLQPEYKSIMKTLKGNSLREAIDRLIDGDNNKTV